MLRKVSMVMVDVVLGPSGVAVQALIALFMLALMFVGTSKASPFEEPHILRLEMMSLTTSLLTLWLGSFFWATTSNDSDLHMGISILIFAINIIFLLYFAKILVRDTCRDFKVVEIIKDVKKKGTRRISSLGSRASALGRRGILRISSRGSNDSSNAPEGIYSTQNSTQRWDDESRTSSLPESQILWPEDGEMKTKSNPLEQGKSRGDVEAGGVEMTQLNSCKHSLTEAADTGKSNKKETSAAASALANLTTKKTPVTEKHKVQNNREEESNAVSSVEMDDNPMRNKHGI